MKRRMRGNPERNQQRYFKAKEFSATWNIERRLFCSVEIRRPPRECVLQQHSLHQTTEVHTGTVLESFEKMLSKIPSALLLAACFHRESPSSSDYQLFSAPFPDEVNEFFINKIIYETKCVRADNNGGLLVFHCCTDYRWLASCIGFHLRHPLTLHFGTV